MADAATAFFTAKFADVAVNTGRPRTALELADQAQSLARDASPTTRHAIQAIKAEVVGALGDPQTTRHGVDSAEEGLADLSPDDLKSEPWALHYARGGRYHYHRARAQNRLVLANPEAVSGDLISDTCSAFQIHCDQDLGDRHVASARLRAASTLLIGREPDEAVAVGRQALSVLPSLRSARVRDDVHDVVRAAAPFRRRPEVADLLHDLSTATTR